MNAVEAVEQLVAVGRRVQQREQRLQQPLAALQFSPLWETVLADPLASLEARLARPGLTPQVPQPVPQQRAGSRRLPQPAAFSPAFPMHTPPEEQQAGQQDREQNRPAQPSPAHPLTLSPPTGVRLARRQSSLLGILSANVGENMPGATSRDATSHELLDAPAGPHVGVRPTLDGGQGEDRSQARWDDVTGAPPDVGGAQSFSAAIYGIIDETSTPSSRLQDTTQLAPANASSLHNQIPQSAQQAVGSEAAPWQSQPMQPTSVGLAWDSSEFIRSGLARPGEDADILQTPIQTLPPLASNAVAHTLAHPRQPLVGTLSPAKPGPDDSVWATAPAASSERPLSLAQIEQVLAALDERLELMLLRMYGTSGSQ